MATRRAFGALIYIVYLLIFSRNMIASTRVWLPFRARTVYVGNSYLCRLNERNEDNCLWKLLLLMGLANAKCRFYDSSLHYVFVISFA